MESPIKWSGSKRPLAKEIISHFPSNKEQDGTFYELFCGSCAITLEMILGKYPDKCGYQKFICIDNNEDLINLWQHIKTSPSLLANGYEDLWKLFNECESVGQVLDCGHVVTIEQCRKSTFNIVRSRFNDRIDFNKIVSRNIIATSAEKLWNNNVILYDFDLAIYFMFLLRTCFNGLTRYNSAGIYNSSCHFTRPGIHPDKMRKILEDTSKLLHEYNVEFKCEDYKNIIPNKNDWVFMDPPYSSVGNGTGKKSMYHGGIDTSELIEYCNNLKCGYTLTFDGDRGEDNKANKISLIDTKIVNLKKKNSSYSRMNGKQVDVSEIMYLKN